MRKYLLPFIGASSLVGVSGSALAWEDISPNFVPAFENQAVGAAESVDWAEYETRCLARVPLTGTCLTGQRSRAKGSMQVTSLTSQSGRILERTEGNPLHPETGSHSEFASDLFFEFRYEGTTEAESYTNEVLTDRPWGDLHPGGRIQVWLTAGNEDANLTWKLRYAFIADPGHDDKPNWFVVNYVAPKLKERMANSVRSILHINNLIIE